MSGTEAELDLTVWGDRPEELPLPPDPPPPPPTPRQRARTRANLPPREPEPPPPPPVEPGPQLKAPEQVLRQPRGGISINGKRADRLLVEMDVTNNRYFTADSFRCSLVLIEDDPDFGRAFWQDTDRLDCEFFVGLGVDEPPSKSLLAGRADELQIDLAARRVTLSGRDYTADLIETTLTEKWPNKTASEIARILAEKAGLSAEVTETSARVGTYYAREHAHLADETTAWTLLTYLAEREGFDCYVQGRTLHFAPPPDPKSAPRWTLQYTPGEPDARAPRTQTMGLQLTKSLTISRELVVRVVSWNSSKKRSIEGMSRSRRPARSSGGQFQSAVNYVFRIPGLTEEQADERARQLALDLTKNLRSFDADLPGHPDIDIRTIVTITGTGGSFDTEYMLDEIERRISQGYGFSMRLRGRNVTPDSTAAL